MVRAWYMDDEASDQRLEHHRTPPEFLSLGQLFDLTAVEYFQLDPQSVEKDGKLEEIKKARGYTYEDQLICSEKCLENYHEKLKMFYQEHLHKDEEIRLVLEGSGYFDVRDRSDQWIRIEVVPGDLIILPSGIYHRFTLDMNNYVKAKRFFVGEPVWQPYNRPADEMDCRKNYLDKLKIGLESKPLQA